MNQPRLYNDLARWFGVLSQSEEYTEEAERIRPVLRERLGPGRHTLLDLGAGAGHLLAHFTGQFDAVAVDLSADMLAQCRQLNPEVECHVGDMRAVRLGRKFDAVLIGDAVDYLLSEDDIRATLTTAAEHLSPGGVLVMAPDLFRETFPDRFVSHIKGRDGNVELTYIEYIHDPDPADSTFEVVMFFLIHEAGQLRVEQDVHTEGLFSRDVWLRLMREAGFAAQTRPYVASQWGADLELLVGMWQ